MDKAFADLLLKGALPVDPYDLSKAFSVISSVYQKTMQSYRHSSNEQFGVEETETGSYDDGDLKEILYGLKDWYHEETQEQFLSLCWRIFALCELIREEVLNAWVKYDPLDSHIRIPGVVILAAASVPLQSQEGFDPREFIQAIHLYQDR